MELRIDDININYEISGQGENVLVLHGWGGCIDSMRPIINHLSNRFKVTSIDFPGHGKSDYPSTSWGVPEYTENLHKLLNALDITKTHIIAHSFGGRVSIMLSTLYPNLIDKLILIDSGGIKPKRSLKYYFKVYSFKLMKSGLKVFVRDANKYDNLLKKLRSRSGSLDYQKLPENMKSSFVKIVNLDLKPYLKNIQSPTVLIWGENDKDTPVYMGRIMQKEIKDCGLIVIKNAGHFSYLDQSYQVLRIIDSFLGGK
jgi:pimeloyl-ACP methyl ester carboxylesterase